MNKKYLIILPVLLIMVVLCNTAEAVELSATIQLNVPDKLDFFVTIKNIKPLPKPAEIRILIPFLILDSKSIKSDTDKVISIGIYNDNCSLLNLYTTTDKNEVNFTISESIRTFYNIDGRRRIDLYPEYISTQQISMDINKSYTIYKIKEIIVEFPRPTTSAELSISKPYKFINNNSISIDTSNAESLEIVFPNYMEERQQVTISILSIFGAILIFFIGFQGASEIPNWKLILISLIAVILIGIFIYNLSSIPSSQKITFISKTTSFIVPAILLVLLAGYYFVFRRFQVTFKGRVLKERPDGTQGPAQVADIRLFKLINGEKKLKKSKNTTKANGTFDISVFQFAKSGDYIISAGDTHRDYDKIEKSVNNVIRDGNPKEISDDFILNLRQS